MSVQISMYSILDVVAEQYLDPFFAQNDEVAKRMVSIVANGAEHGFNRHPDDYILFRVGVFDRGTGEVQPTAKPYHISRIRDLLRGGSSEGPTDLGSLVEAKKEIA